ncbi:hypothetical protein [Hydrogenobacter thermophilus]|uniref:hypothetical protein n=1 Tax=Hydrogenobacter thermophilus TaxID=940 RepID=UPI0030F4D06F
MLKIILFSLSLITLFTLLKLYVEKTYQDLPKVRQEERGVAQDISIKAYGKSGIEWTLKGKSLYAEGRSVMLKDALLHTDKERIRADQVFIDRDTLKGYAEGKVEILGEDFYAQTDRADLDLKDGKIWGEGRVFLKEDKKETEGRGFQVQLRPLKIIIKSARVKLE